MHAIVAQIWLDYVLGTWTRGGIMVGKNEATELWRYLKFLFFISC